jgi:N-(5-amino-5-carboxypentanoyl)-L-cysteinyl-D-valine synthase
VHHVIVDRVSWTIILRDLELLYNDVDLTFEGLDYRQWASVLRSYAPEPGETELWREVADGVADDLRSQDPSEEEISTGGRRLSVSPDQLARLRSLAGRGGAPDIHNLLLAAIGHAARDLEGLPSRYITVENHGREPFNPRWQIERTVGWFTTLHPVCVAVAANPMDTARRVKAWRDRVPHNGFGYALLLGPLGSAETPLPPISFNYLGRIAAARDKSPTGPDARRWQLDPDMFGLRNSVPDRGTSRGTLDVTAWLAGDELIVAIGSGLAPAKTEQFGDRLIEAIGDICNRSATGKDFRSADLHDRMRDFDPMVIVERAPGAPDIFLLPPGEGGAESYLGNLSRHLGAVNQILFNNVNRHCRHGGIEEIAAYYISKIRERRPSGPYNLLGWSFGGVVALEIARHLAREEDRVDNLMLIDPFWRLDKAAQDLQLEDISAVIDSINMRYVQRREDFEPLLRTVGRITLFKATVYNEATLEIERQRLFEYYARTSHNHLDTLIPANSIHIRSLGSCDHFSWVQDAALVAEMGRQVSDLLRSNPSHLDKVVSR